MLFKKLIISLIFPFLLVLTNCAKDVDGGLSAEEKRRKNIDEGRGVSLKGIVGSRNKTNYEFSSSNPMWRASLETLDFLPLTTVDYSGGIIITDWYSENTSNDSIKITIRFLSNEIRSDSLKIIVHKKTCSKDLVCKTNLSSGNVIKNELRSTILRKAAIFQKTQKEKK